MRTAARDIGFAALVTEQARNLLEVGRAEEAARLLGQAIAADPDTLQARCLLALALQQLGRVEEALRAAREASAHHPESEWPLRLQSILLLALRRPAPALAAAERAAGLAPAVPEVLHTLARAQLAGRRRAEARKTAATVAALAPDAPYAHELLGLIALDERRWKEAEACFRRAAALDPRSWTILNNLGVALQGQRRRKEAIEAFHESARLNPLARTSQQNLRDAVSAYVGGGAFFLLVAIRLALAIEGPLTHARNVLQDELFLGAALVVLVASFLWRQWRLSTIDPEVADFYREETGRIGRGEVGAVAVLLGVVLVSIGAAVWTLVLLLGGPRAAGLDTVTGDCTYAGVIACAIGLWALILGRRAS